MIAQSYDRNTSHLNAVSHWGATWTIELLHSGLERAKQKLKRVVLTLSLLPNILYRDKCLRTVQI